MPDVIDIPARCREVKADYDTFPEPALVREIKAFIAAGNLPHEWRGHTHTKPPQGARIVYVDEFDVAAPAGVEEVAPCPVCCPDRPKYKRAGKIAWFPDERVIRLIGPNCFSTINAEGHAEAEAEFRQRQRRERDITYLADSAGKLGELSEVLGLLTTTCKALDDLGSNLRSRLRLISKDLFRHVRTGVLMRHDPRERKVEDDKGNVSIEAYSVEVEHARAYGVELLDPACKDIGPRAAKAQSDLDQLRAMLGDGSTVKLWDDARRSTAMRLLHKAMTAARECLEAARARQRFISPSNIATLRTWGRRQDSALHIEIDRQGMNFIVGRDRHATTRIAMKAGVDAVLRDLPRVADL
jgi:hypothetical protein